MRGQESILTFLKLIAINYINYISKCVLHAFYKDTHTHTHTHTHVA